MEHHPQCRWRKAIQMPIGIECDCGYDVCLKCDACNCEELRQNEAHKAATLDKLADQMLDAAQDFRRQAAELRTAGTSAYIEKLSTEDWHECFKWKLRRPCWHMGAPHTLTFILEPTNPEAWQHHMKLADPLKLVPAIYASGEVKVKLAGVLWMATLDLACMTYSSWERWREKILRSPDLELEDGRLLLNDLSAQIKDQNHVVSKHRVAADRLKELRYIVRPDKGKESLCLTKKK